MNKQSQDFILNGQIAISVAESSDIEALGMSQDKIRSLVLELSRQILNAGGRMIYGGKLNRGGFTELFKEFTNQYCQGKNGKEGEAYFTNFLAWPYYNSISEINKANYKSSGFNLVNASPSEYVSADLHDKFIALNDLQSRYLYSTSMTSMRLQAEQNALARIIVGGKTTGFSGCMPGVLEEFFIAMRLKHPVYLIGGFGGATKIITDIIERKDGMTYAKLLNIAMTDPQYKILFNYYKERNHSIDDSALYKIKIEDLENGLTVEQNRTLFHSTNIDEISHLILLGLNVKLNCKNKKYY